MCELCRQNPCHPACPNAEPDRHIICENCGEWIREGDRYFNSPLDGTILCESCVDDATKELDFEEYDYWNSMRD